MNNDLSFSIFDDAFILFDFDGTLACPTYGKYTSCVGLTDNTYTSNLANNLKNHPILNLRPVVNMPAIIANINKRFCKTRIGVLSACCMGSIEVFDKIEFLNKNYPNIDWKKHFYSTATMSEKKEFLETFIRYYNDAQDKPRRIIYVDDNLETLIEIEKHMNHEITANLPLLTLHVTTFLSYFDEYKARKE